MLYKLLETGIDPRTFLAIRAMYSNMSNCVRYHNKHSKWFDVLQGTRQGSRCFPLLYLLYINGYISTLAKSKTGFLLYDTKNCSPGLPGLLPTCYWFPSLYQDSTLCSIFAINIPSNGSINSSQANAQLWYLMNVQMGLQPVYSTSKITDVKKRMHMFTSVLSAISS